MNIGITTIQLIQLNIINKDISSLRSTIICNMQKSWEKSALKYMEILLRIFNLWIFVNGVIPIDAYPSLETAYELFAVQLECINCCRKSKWIYAARMDTHTSINTPSIFFLPFPLKLNQSRVYYTKVSLTIFRRKFIDFLIIAIRIKSIKCIDRCNIIENKYKSVTLNICMWIYYRIDIREILIIFRVKITLA